MHRGDVTMNAEDLVDLLVQLDEVDGAPLRVRVRSEVVEFIDLMSSLDDVNVVFNTAARTDSNIWLLSRVVHSDALIVSAGRFSRLPALSEYVLLTQDLICLDGEPNDPGIVDAVWANLSGREIGMLFIDAKTPHSNVEDIFWLYSKALSENGLVVFDGINMHGIDNDYRVSGTNTFWKSIKHYYHHKEIVDSAAGYGIGILSMSERDGFIAPTLPHVSVVTACYNNLAALKVALPKWKDQTYKSFEVIIVDDGSKNGDEIEAFVTGLGYKYFKIEDYGYRVSAARNVGIWHARGHLIVFLDSDVIPDSGLIAAHVKNEDRFRLTVGMRDGAYASNVDEVVCYDSRRDVDFKKLSEPWYSAFGCNLAVWRKRLVEIGGFDEQNQHSHEYRVTEDVDVATRLFKIGVEIVGVSDAFGLHISHESNYIPSLPGGLAILQYKCANPAANDYVPPTWVYDGKIGTNVDVGRPDDYAPLDLTDDYIRKLLEYDILVCNDYYRFTAEACSVHPNAFVLVSENVLRNPQYDDSTRKWIDEIIHRRARHFIAATENVRVGLMRAGIESSRISVIPYWSDNTNDFKGVDLTGAEAAAIREKYAISPGDLVLSCVGDLNDVSGMQWLLKAVDTITTGVLVLAGSGNVDAWMDSIHPLNRHRIHCVDRLDDNDLIDLYNVSDAYIQPSVPHRGGVDRFGSAVTGAMACSLPCIVSDIEGMASIVDDGITGFVIPCADSQAIASRVNYLFSDQGARYRMGSAGRLKAEREYSLDVVQRRLGKCYMHHSLF